jgi:hypothetical protein
MLWGTRVNKGSWREDFLVNDAGKSYNPFDPTCRIKIAIPSNNREGCEKMAIKQ